MSFKILTKNGIGNSNIDGARGEYFNSGMRDGIVRGALNEGTFMATSSNVISLSTCELRICGHRIVIDEPVYHTFANSPSTDTRYSLIAQIVVDDNQNVDFSLFVQTANTQLIQNDLYKTITGAGTYQVEIGRFTLLTTLSIEDVVRTIDVITGGIGKGNGGKINIGDVTTQTLDPDVDAEVDVDDRYEEDEGKEYLDFKFSIPKGDKGDKGEQGIQGIQGVQGEKGDKGDKGDTNSLSIGTVTTGEAGSQASATITGDAPNQTLNLTIPKGDTGATGQNGQDGTNAIITNVTASVDSNIGTPSVDVTVGGTEQARTFDFAFHNLKGETGEVENSTLVNVNGQPQSTINFNSDPQTQINNKVDKSIITNTNDSLFESLQPYEWIDKTWNGLTDFYGSNIWTDGTNIYYSYQTTQKVLNKATSTWEDKTWNGLTDFYGSNIWTDGTNIYYSLSSTQKILNKETSTWEDKVWNGFTSLIADYIWTDGVNIYYSSGSTQKVLNKATSTWEDKIWSGLTSFTGSAIWTDGTNIYYSSGSTQQKVLDKETSTWNDKTWNGFTNFNGASIWTDGDNIYYSTNTSQYILNRKTSTWENKIWDGLTYFSRTTIWTDGTNIYYSSETTQKVLSTKKSIDDIYKELENKLDKGSSITLNGGTIAYDSSTDTFSI